MENNARSNPQPPQGYPTVVPAELGGVAAGNKGSCPGTTTKRGEPSFIEGCIAAVCCCWLCELCCD